MKVLAKCKTSKKDIQYYEFPEILELYNIQIAEDHFYARERMVNN